MKTLLLILLASATAAEKPIKMTGDIYRKGKEWLITAAPSDTVARKSQFRLLDLSMDKNFTKDRIFGQIEGVLVDCIGTLPCVRVKSFSPALYDPLSAKK